MGKPVMTLTTQAAPGVKIALWENTNGLAATISKSYKTKDGEWKDSTSFFAQDLAALSVLIPRAVAAIDKAKKQQQPERREEQQKFEDTDIPF